MDLINGMSLLPFHLWRARQTERSLQTAQSTKNFPALWLLQTCDQFRFLSFTIADRSGPEMWVHLVLSNVGLITEKIRLSHTTNCRWWGFEPEPPGQESKLFPTQPSSILSLIGLFYLVHTSNVSILDPLRRVLLPTNRASGDPDRRVRSYPPALLNDADVGASFFGSSFHWTTAHERRTGWLDHPCP
jgi:hypothetical protein